jgi:uncharacterized protein (TIGR02466 family)
MNYANIFPTTIGYEYNNTLTDRILPIAKEYLSDESQLTYEWNYKNTYGNMIDDSRLSFVYEKIAELSNTYLIDSNVKPPEKLEIQIFFSEVYGCDTHVKHTHPGSLLSGLFYLHVPQDAAPIIFYDNSPHYDFIPYVPLRQEEERRRYVIQPVTGMILIWNSWYQHEVPKSDSQEARITAVFNVARK